MKTMSFGTVNVSYTEEGECILKVFSPSEGTVEIHMSPDELMMFLVEVSNGLKDARAAEVRKVIERNLRREERRV